MDIDAIYAQLHIMYADETVDVKIRFVQTFYDDGMDPVTIVIYDLVGYWTDPIIVQAEGRTCRRIVVLQGKRKETDLILDYMEGW